jgi:hypothetical protein
VQKLERGLYLVRWYDEDGVQRGSRVRGKAEADVLDAQHKARRAVRRVGAAAGRRVTLQEYVDEWEQTHLPVLAASTRRQQRQVLQTWVLPRLGGRRLGELDQRAVAAWRASILPQTGQKPVRGKAASPTQANHALRALSAVLGYAVADGYLEANPCAGMRKVRQSVRAQRVLTPEEIERLRAAMPTLRDAVLVGLIGVRRSPAGRGTSSPLARLL